MDGSRWHRVPHEPRPHRGVSELAAGWRTRPSTRHVDRTRKLDDYRLGGAHLYLLVDLPSSFELHDFSAGGVVKSTGSIDLEVGGQPVRFTLP